MTKELKEMIHQFIGYNLCKQGFGIVELISSAGLTKEEWYKIKDQPEYNDLSNQDIKEIEEYFNIK